MGTSNAHCLESHTHLKAARRATSVLPKPTSPQSSLSMGASRSISFLISSMQRIMPHSKLRQVAALGRRLSKRIRSTVQPPMSATMTDGSSSSSVWVSTAA